MPLLCLLTLWHVEGTRTRRLFYNNKKKTTLYKEPMSHFVDDVRKNDGFEP